MQVPELSIVMPVYNSEQFIKQAVESLLSQSFDDFELIIVDDGSTDGSAEMISGFRDERIRLLENEAKRGIVFSRNRGLAEAKGKFIAPFDSDDVAMPEKFVKQIDYLKKHSEIGMIGSWAVIIDQTGQPTGKKWKLNARMKHIPAIMLFRNYFVQSAVVLRREVIPRGGYTCGFDIIDDYKMWWDILKKSGGWNYPEYLVKYRIHKSSVTQSDRNRMLERERRIYDTVFSELGIRLSDEQFGSLMMIKNDQPLQHQADLSRIESFLILILDANQFANRFDQAILKKVVMNRWLKACNKLQGNYFSAASHMIHSKLFKKYFKSICHPIR